MGKLTNSKYHVTGVMSGHSESIEEYIQPRLGATEASWRRWHLSCQTGEGKCSGTQDQRGREGKARTWNAGQSFSSARARRQLVGRRGQGEGLGRRVTGQGGAWGGDCVCGVGVGGCGQSLRTGRPRFKQVCGKLVVME